MKIKSLFIILSLTICSCDNFEKEHYENFKYSLDSTNIFLYTYNTSRKTEKSIDIKKNLMFFRNNLSDDLKNKKIYESLIDNRLFIIEEYLENPCLNKIEEDSIFKKTFYNLFYKNYNDYTENDLINFKLDYCNINKNSFLNSIEKDIKLYNKILNDEPIKKYYFLEVLNKSFDKIIKQTFEL